ncbi:MAG: hypothetical protein QW303_00585 [Nitrososphaerota archaeon]
MTTKFTADQIIQIIEKHKSNDDPHGDSAFKIDYENPFPSQKGGTFYNFLIENSSGTFEPLKIKFQDCISLFDSKSALFPGFSISFSVDSVYIQKNGIEQKIGLAVDLCSQAYVRIMNRLLKENKISNDNPRIIEPVRRHRKDKNTGQKIANKRPFWVVKVPFKRDEKDIADNTVASIDIFDAKLKIPPDDPRYKPRGLNFELARYEGEPIVYKNIGKYIARGSKISGFMNMSSIFCGTTGNILICTALTLIVNSYNINHPSPDDIFTTDEFNTNEEFED